MGPQLERKVGIKEGIFQMVKIIVCLQRGKIADAGKRKGKLLGLCSEIDVGMDLIMQHKWSCWPLLSARRPLGLKRMFVLSCFMDRLSFLIQSTRLSEASICCKASFLSVQQKCLTCSSPFFMVQTHGLSFLKVSCFPLPRIFAHVVTFAFKGTHSVVSFRHSKHFLQM